MEQLQKVMDRTTQVRLAQLARAYPLDQEEILWGFMGPRQQIYELLSRQFGLTIQQIRDYFEGGKHNGNRRRSHE